MSKNDDADNPWEYRNDLYESAQKHSNDEEDRIWLEQRDKRIAIEIKNRKKENPSQKQVSGGSVNESYKRFRADSAGYLFFLLLVAFFIYIFIDGCNK